MNHRAILVALVAIFATLQLAQCSPQAFVASIKIYNDPDILGTLSGTYFYNKNTNYSRTNYAVGANEIIDSTNQVRYLRYNGTCEAYTSQLPLAALYKESSDTAVGSNVTISGRGSCAGWKKASNTSGVDTIYVDSSSYICRAVYSSGKTVDFVSIISTSEPNSGNFSISSWNCPTSACNKPIDIMLVFDVSGSISSSNYKLMLNFGVNIAKSFTFGSNAVRMGLVLFHTTSVVRSTLTANQTDFINTVNTTDRITGNTCIGCGLQTAQTIFDTAGRNTTRMMIVLTDGYNNVNTNTYPSILAAVKAAGTLIFAVGVSPYSSSFLVNMASNITGTQTVFYSTDYSALSGIVSTLTTSTCLEITGTPCGKSCQGFCATNQTCICPDLCEASTACQSGKCTAGVYGNGCSFSDISCDFGDKCKNYWCDNSLGCQSSTKNCNDNDACTSDSCDSSIGCIRQNITCPSDPCTVGTCYSATGCVNTTRTCDRCSWPATVTCPKINCKVEACNSTDGQCYYTTKDCSSNNLCINDGCDTSTGECTHTAVSCDDNLACTVDGCNAATGCYHTALNCTQSNKCYTYSCAEPNGCVQTPVNCDDGNACTIDSCDAALGCIHTTRDCSTNNPCLLGQCNTATGCYNTTQDCDRCTYPTVVTCPHIACKTGVCDPSSGNCTYTDIDCSSSDRCFTGYCNTSSDACETVAVNCNDGNACTTDTCNGGCIHTAVDCDGGNKCKNYFCNTTTGCYSTDVNCDDNDPCTADSCSPSVGCVNNQISCPYDACTSAVCVTGVGCVNTSVPCDHCTTPVVVTCPDINCKTASCNSSTGLCVYSDVVCETNNACVTDYCDVTDGQCKTNSISCDDGKACTIDSCDETTGCVHETVSNSYCDDLNACTIDSCSNSTGCVYTNITCPAITCKVNTGCDAVQGCLYETMDCSNYTLPDQCHVAVCQNDKCVAEEIDGTYDACGTCQGSVESEAICFLQENQTAVALSGGALAGVIIAVAAAVGLMSFGGYKGYEFYKKQFESSNAVQDNPLYKEKRPAVDNPLYSPEEEMANI
mmetsp:Transcript_23848/g.33421  ORF Transcript_23848/g.33421 Transcript_23848/m.33421 type:complete len:1051 (+) Transcript_23848:230-3382(+)